MTIEKGQAWGEPVGGDSAAVPVAKDDAELAAMVGTALADDEHLIARVLAGDLLRTLGLADGRGAGDGLVAYPIDLGLARLTVDVDGHPGEPLPFVAHVTAGRAGSLARLLGHGAGVTVAVMNAAWLHEYRFGPRAHPNDGLLDITTGQVPFRHRREAAKRARTGSHIPHPALQVRRTDSWSIDFSAPRSIFLDGVAAGRARSLSVEVVPDAFTIVA